MVCPDIRAKHSSAKDDLEWIAPDSEKKQGYRGTKKITVIMNGLVQYCVILINLRELILITSKWNLENKTSIFLKNK